MMQSARWRSIVKATRRFASNRRGGVFILFAIALIPLIAMVGLAVDSARAYLVNARLGQAIDAAALAGGRAFRKNYRDEDVQRYFDANFPANFMDVELEPLSIVFDDETKEVTVTGSASVPTTFMRVLNITEVEVSSRAVVNALNRGLELALILDVTGSMGGSKIESLKTAVSDLLDILYGDEETIDNLWVSVVPFAARTNFHPHSDWMEDLPDDWTGCGDPRSGAHATNDAPPSAELWPEFEGRNGNENYGCPTSEILPLTAEKTTVGDTVEELSTGGSTRTDVGMVWGWRVISPNWRGLWGDPDLPLDYGTENMDKAVILMTDGENTPHLTDDDLTVDETNAQLSQECEDMKNEGILVYTITFQAPESLDTIFEDCASASDYYFKSPTDEDLAQAFKTIAAQLSKLRIAQ